MDNFGTPTETTPQGSTPNSLDDLLKGIVNEHGEQKYKSLEDALKALDHSQRYIPELRNQLTGNQTELAGLKAELAKFGNIEETVQRLLQTNQPPAATPPAATGISEADVLRLVQQSLQQSTAAATAESNFKLVNDSLVGKYGDKTGEVVAAKARELKTTPEDLVALSKRSPDLVMQLFQTTAPSETIRSSGGRVAPPPVSVVGEAKKPEGKSLLVGITDKQRGAYFHDLRKEIYGKMGYEVQ